MSIYVNIYSKYFFPRVCLHHLIADAVELVQQTGVFLMI